jgi:hypothetical protein
LVAFTTTDPDDRAFLVTAARHHGFTDTKAATQVTLTADWGRAADPEARGRASATQRELAQ